MVGSTSTKSQAHNERTNHLYQYIGAYFNSYSDLVNLQTKFFFLTSLQNLQVKLYITFHQVFNAKRLFLTSSCANSELSITIILNTTRIMLK